MVSRVSPQTWNLCKWKSCCRETPDVWWADKVCRKWKALTTFLEGNRQHIFYLTLFYVTTAILFIDKFISMCQCWRDQTSLKVDFNLDCAIVLLCFCRVCLPVGTHRHEKRDGDGNSHYQGIRIRHVILLLPSHPLHGEKPPYPPQRDIHLPVHTHRLLSPVSQGDKLF